MNRNIQKITDSYLSCAAWSDSPEDATSSVFGSLSKALAYSDCAVFVAQAGDLLTDDWADEQIGHDFWLTRNDHGTGFWDRDLPNADALTMIATAFKTNYLFVSGNDELEIG